MSEKETASDMAEEKIEIIMPEAIISVNMDTGYYRRIQEIVGFMVSEKTQEQLQHAHDQISSQVVTEPWVQHYETLLILCKEFEQNAKNNGHTKLITHEEAAKLFSEN